ncbi:MAG: hypothetical protein WAK33_04305, partial [Silvibacterium sp.]
KLKAEISSLYDTLIEIKDKVLDLTEENRSLKAQLAAKGEIEGPVSPHGYSATRIGPISRSAHGVFKKIKGPFSCLRCSSLQTVTDGSASCATFSTSKTRQRNRRG